MKTHIRLFWGACAIGFLLLSVGCRIQPIEPPATPTSSALQQDIAVELISQADFAEQAIAYCTQHVHRTNADYYTYGVAEGKVLFYEQELADFISTVTVTAKMTLKANSVIELPAVRGALDAVNIKTDPLGEVQLSWEDIYDKIQKNFPDYDPVKIELAAEEVYYLIENGYLSIGTENEFTYTFKLLGTIEDSIIRVDRILLYQGDFNYIDGEIMQQDSPDAFYQKSRDGFWKNIEERFQTISENR